jgi:hypothetical protein
MMMMMMGWDFASELRPTSGLLFIPEVIYEHAGLQWNDIDWGKLLIRPTELSCNPTAELLGSKAWGTSEGNEFCLKTYLSYFEEVLTCRKMLRHLADGFTSLSRGVLRIFIARRIPPPSAGFEPVKLGSRPLEHRRRPGLQQPIS